jgi:subtilisin-like proprotein convertase family protein
VQVKRDERIRRLGLLSLLVSLSLLVAGGAVIAGSARPSRPGVATSPAETMQPVEAPPPTDPVAPPETTPAEVTQPTDTKPSETTETTAANTAPAESTQPPVTSLPSESTEPPLTSAPTATSEPTASSEPTTTTEPTATSEPTTTTEPTATSEPTGPPPIAGNPGVGATCGLKVMLVVDRSGSGSAAALGNAVGAVVGALADTESSVAVADFSTVADLRVGYTVVDDASRGTFDAYASSLGTGGAADWGAGLAGADTGSPDVTVLITGGGPNGTDDPRTHGANQAAAADRPLFSAIEQANEIKGGGSRLFALGVGGADPAALAAVSGPRGGTDVAASDFATGDVDAVASSLHALAVDACPPVESRDVSALAGPSDFPNPGTITITSPPDAGGPPVAASPYPSSIAVSGMTGLVTDVNVHLFGVTHAIAQDIDILLVGPTGASLVVMSDVPGGGGFGASNANLTFDDQAATGVPATGVLSGNLTFKPTDNDVNQTLTDSWPSPAPAPGPASTLSAAFTGTNANGMWRLFVVDDAQGDNGSIASGWSLTITTEEAAVATTTDVVSSPNPSLTGASVTFTATVTSSGSPVTTGTVTFTEGTTTLASGVALNASGQAAFSTAALAEGAHVVTATYSGATGFLASNDSVTQVVDNPTTTPAEGQWCNTGAINIPDAGQSTPYPSHITVSGAGTLTSQVTAQLASLTHTARIDLDILLVGPAGQNILLMSDVGGATVAPQLPPTVTLTFADSAAAQIPFDSISSGMFKPSNNGAGDTLPGAPAVSAATTLATFNGTNPNGVWSLYAFDDATGDSGTIAGGWCLNIATAAPTTTALTSSPNPSTFGQPVTFTATVTSGGSPVTAGTVNFTEGSTTLASAVTVTASGQAIFTTSTLAVGIHPITATYNGTTAFQTSTSPTLNHTVRAVTTTALASTPNPSTFGQPVTFTATVTSGGNPVTQGTVTFTESATTLASNVAVNGSGQATFTTSSPLSVGDHTIAATFNGTTNLATSTGTVTQTVDQIATTTTLASSDSTTTFGEPVTFTASVTGGGSPVTVGTVTFRDGADVLATIALDGAGQAGFTTSTLAVGDHTITASFNGATNFATSTSSPLDQVVDGVADAGGPYTIDEGGDLALDGTGSIAGAGATFSWDVNDDGTFGDATGATPTLTWAQLESLGISDGTGVPTTITLQLTDGPTFTAVTALTVDNVAPTATLSSDGPVPEGSTATVTFTGQADPSADDLAALVYGYDFDNDGTFEVTSSSSASASVPASFLADGPGTRTVRAVVADDDGGSLELTTDIAITNAAATATITGPSTAVVGVPVTLKVGADDPSPGDMNGTFAFTVDWGDGTPVVSLTGPADPPVTHTYTRPGTFTVTATATDPDGATSAELTFTITVAQAPPTTTSSTTTTTEPGSTTTTEPSATTSSTTTTVGYTTTSTAIGPGGGSLPRTGGGISGALLAGVALLLAGTAAVAGSRRGRRAAATGGGSGG